MVFQHGKYYRVNGKFYMYIDFNKKFITQYPPEDNYPHLQDDLLVLSANDEYAEHIPIKDAAISEE